MERAEELFDRNDDGEWVDPAKIDWLELLASQCPPRLKGYRVNSLELSNQERLQSIIEEVTNDKCSPTILYIDEIHTLVGAGSAEGQYEW